ncbi:MAG: DUF1073 domain-containing protein, partial [Pseudomonadota bacterium]|nr:DUF1073 domain-containing protein [Pseudomonadota bacterium]
RDSVSDMVHSFSVMGVKTNMQDILSGVSSANDTSIFDRADLFNNLRDNRGLFLLDKDSEEFFLFNVPLNGLDALQAQSQEQIASVASIPLVKLLGIQPAGLNASADGEIRVFYDHIHAWQEILFGANLQIVLQILQLHEFGEIDDDIGYEFQPLYELSELDRSTVRKNDADTDAVLISVGAISPDDSRQRVASDPESLYHGLDVDDGEDLDDREDDLQANAMLRDK